MSQDRPTDKLSFRHWLIHGCLQVLSEPQYGRALVERAVREHVALPIAICRQAEEIADRIEKALLLAAAGAPTVLSAPAERIWQAYDRYATE